MSEPEKKETSKLQETSELIEPDIIVKDSSVKMIPAYKLVKTIEVGIKMIPGSSSEFLKKKRTKK
jgi:hypothetical protein